MSEDLLIEYNYFPSISGKMRVVDLYIFKNYIFKIHFFWHKMPESRQNIEKNYQSRRHSIFEEKLPKELIDRIEELLSFPKFEIKRTYPELTFSQKQEYEPSDIGNEFYTFYINDNKSDVNVNPWYFQKRLLKTEQELKFLEFHEQTLNFIEKIFKKIQNETL